MFLYKLPHFKYLQLGVVQPEANSHIRLVQIPKPYFTAILKTQLAVWCSGAAQTVVCLTLDQQTWVQICSVAKVSKLKGHNFQKPICNIELAISIFHGAPAVHKDQIHRKNQQYWTALTDSGLVWNLIRRERLKSLTLSLGLSKNSFQQGAALFYELK